MSEHPAPNYRFVPILRATLDVTGLQSAPVEGTCMVPVCDATGVTLVRIAGSTPSVTTPAGGNVSSTPGAGAKASATAPAVLNKKWNAVSLSWSLGDTAAVAAPLTVVLRDGASGVGTILWSTQIGPLLAGTSRSDSIVWPPGFGPGNAAVNTALTLEFLNAPAGTGFESVSLVAYESAPT
jgi:hypothetical protein